MRNGIGIRTLARLGGFLCLTLATARLAEGQVAPDRFFVDPVLILSGGGHHSPVRSMVFATPNGSQLLTGGMDKVIHVWNLDADRSGPARTLRPPNWRGKRGQVNAMALSTPDAAGGRLLAVGGYGVLGDLGEILLFRYPGEAGQGTGDVVGQLSAVPEQPGRPARPGHSDVVTSLAFTPDGRFLVSASNDKTVRVWEVATRSQVAVMAEATAAVNTLALFSGGTRLVAGGNDGILRTYDLTNPARPVFLSQTAPVVTRNNDPIQSQILTVSASEDERWIVIGTEGGSLVRYDAARPAGQFLPNASTGAVEAVALSPDGNRLATSIITRALPTPNAFPVVTSLVEIRSMPDGRVIETLPIVSNLVQALAFSPDGRRLAYSGGDSQAVHIKELAQNSPAPDEIKGAGASLWDVGFRADGRAIRFARVHPSNPGQAPPYEYFDLRGRSFFNPEANEPAYRHALASEAGWTIRPLDPFQFDFLDAQGRGWRRTLDPANERRWWAYTVIPPGPGHPQPVAAVASDSAIVLWNLATGVKTRSFNGHSGPVYALASSPDGKWLLTGSSDQTVRLWPLAGCDQTPPFGARFERRAEGWVVVEVTPGGFADGISLKPGHVVEETYVSDGGPAVKVDPATVLPRLDQESPTKMFSFIARMPGQADPLRGATTKRDSPALTLFPGVDRRWVMWTPRGYYDSSADGDRRFLGWLTNRGSVAQLLAATFDSIDKFEARYRQPKGPNNLLDRLLDTADPLQAVAAVAPAINLPEPSTSRLDALTIAPAVPSPTDRPVGVAAPTILVNYRASAANGAAPIRQLWVEMNGRRLPDLLAANAAPSPVVQGQLALPIGLERDVRANLVAVDNQGVRRSERLDISNLVPPPPSARKSRLVVIAIGAAEFADKRLSKVEHAEADARDLAKFFEGRLVDPATGVRFEADRVQVFPFLGGAVARAQVLSTFDALRSEAQAGRLGAGDVVALVIESHFLDVRSKRLLVTAEPEAIDGEPPALSATDLADRLGELTRQGCRALVLVDAVHAIQGPAWDNDIREWVRQLQTQANALAFIASDHGSSNPNGKGHRIFAQGVLDSLNAASLVRKRKPGAPFTLLDFERTVVNDVLEKTGRKQHAQLYLPETLSYRIPLLDASTKGP